jgi:hypothetical protein
MGRGSFAATGDPHTGTVASFAAIDKPAVKRYGLSEKACRLSDSVCGSFPGFCYPPGKQCGLPDRFYGLSDKVDGSPDEADGSFFDICNLSEKGCGLSARGFGSPDKLCGSSDSVCGLAGKQGDLNLLFTRM